MAAPRGPDERFPVTQWSLVARAGQVDPEAKREALGQLLQRYWPALRAHLVHRKGLAEAKADDMVQDFIASKIIEKDLIARADRQLGKLRTFLLTALDRFVNNQLRNEQAKKRAPSEGELVAFDERAGGLPVGQRPSEAFDVAWARGVIDGALRQMHDECQSQGRTQIWGVFECRVIGPILEGTEPVDYQELVRRFSFQSPTQASNALTTAKRMYARALRDAVGQYAQGHDAIESEIDELRTVLARSGV